MSCPCSSPENTLPPVFDPDCNPSVISCSRTFSVGSLLLVLNASDPEGQQVKYDILGGSGLGYFQVDQSSGEITVRFSLALIVESYLTQISEQLTVLIVLYLPVFVVESFQVSERVARIFGVDRDIGANGDLSYSLSSELDNIAFVSC